jgi:hypothetical protein
LLHLVSTSNIISRVEGERLKGLRRFVGYYRGHPDPGNDDDLLLAIILENIWMLVLSKSAPPPQSTQQDENEKKSARILMRTY